MNGVVELSVILVFDCHDVTDNCCKKNSARCLKITEKVSFNNAHILSGQKLIKNAKNCPFWRVFENLKLAVKQCYQTGHF